MINFNELRDRAYNTACKHGWHEKELSDEHCLMMIITEIAEAVQADRKGEETHIEDELADIIIRCLDLAGLRNIDIFIEEKEVPQYMERYLNAPFTEFAYLLCYGLTTEDMLIDKLHGVIGGVFLYCKHKGIDIEYFIEQKMKYNETRPYKHGNKKY